MLHEITDYARKTDKCADSALLLARLPARILQHVTEHAGIHDEGRGVFHVHPRTVWACYVDSVAQRIAPQLVGHVDGLREANAMPWATFQEGECQNVLLLHRLHAGVGAVAHANVSPRATAVGGKA